MKASGIRSGAAALQNDQVDIVAKLERGRRAVFDAQLRLKDAYRRGEDLAAELAALDAAFDEIGDICELIASETRRYCSGASGSNE